MFVGRWLCVINLLQSGPLIFGNNRRTNERTSHLLLHHHYNVWDQFLHYLGSMIINHFHHHHQHSVHYHHHHLPAASCRNVWTNKDKMPHWQVHHHHHHLDHCHHHRHQCDHLHHLGCKADEGQTRGQFATARGSLTCNWNPAVRSCSAPTNNTTHTVGKILILILILINPIGIRA